MELPELKLRAKTKIYFLHTEHFIICTWHSYIEYSSKSILKIKLFSNRARRNGAVMLEYALWLWSWVHPLFIHCKTLYFTLHSEYNPFEIQYALTIYSVFGTLLKKLDSNKLFGHFCCKTLDSMFKNM